MIQFDILNCTCCDWLKCHKGLCLTWLRGWCVCYSCHGHVSDAGVSALSQNDSRSTKTFLYFFLVLSVTRRLFANLTFNCIASSQRRRCLHALISLNRLEPLQHLNLFPFSVQVYDRSDSVCTGPVANQSLSFCLAVMHANSQQHILISPKSKAQQSQLTGPPGPARAILKKCFILSVRHMWIWADDFASYVWEFLLPPLAAVFRV